MKYLKTLNEQLANYKTFKDFNISKVLGKGQNGSAYLLNNNRVLKITSNESEYNIALDISPLNLEGVPKIYEVGIFKDSYFFIVREYTKELDINEENTIIKIYDYLESYFNNIFLSDIFFTSNIEHPNKDFIEYLSNKPITNNHIGLYEEISSIFNELSENNIHLTDITYDMFGKIDNKLVVKDIT